MHTNLDINYEHPIQRIIKSMYKSTNITKKVCRSKRGSFVAAIDFHPINGNCQSHASVIEFYLNMALAAEERAKSPKLIDSDMTS